ncbi:hypothetical protein C2845_PM03G28980 [Panicum miliaceum]|uniref:Uncharacterized protein n=1 Tax=Panicum miliaceum TaxID=4540 RepID=A0A3L6T6I6_PANMI|nr:hypothetical protein C2845_PM03G28980 [Panicum miliaceum]
MTNGTHTAVYDIWDPPVLSPPPFFFLSLLCFSALSCSPPPRPRPPLLRPAQRLSSSPAAAQTPLLPARGEGGTPGGPFPPAAKEARAAAPPRLRRTAGQALTAAQTPGHPLERPKEGVGARSWAAGRRRGCSSGGGAAGAQAAAGVPTRRPARLREEQGGAKEKGRRCRPSSRRRSEGTGAALPAPTLCHSAEESACARSIGRRQAARRW